MQERLRGYVWTREAARMAVVALLKTTWFHPATSENFEAALKPPESTRDVKTIVAEMVASGYLTEDAETKELKLTQTGSDLQYGS